jgi:hypothetical protein
VAEEARLRVSGLEDGETPGNSPLSLFVLFWVLSCASCRIDQDTLSVRTCMTTGVFLSGQTALPLMTLVAKLHQTLIR